MFAFVVEEQRVKSVVFVMFDFVCRFLCTYEDHERVFTVEGSEDTIKYIVASMH